ncbi:MAG: heme ABC transporter permease [Pseudomonadota bacterium]
MRWSAYAAPAAFYPLARCWAPWFWRVALLLLAVGLYLSFFVAPTDYKQGEGYRIIFVHVPAAWMSMLIYLVMAGWSLIGLILNTRLSAMMTQALAPTGAMFTFVALWTGAFWGKPMWGTWWEWDARITSELILLFLYLGYLALRNAIPDPRRADRASSLLVLVGVVNIPIIYFSVEWWNTLHQGSSIKLNAQTSMDETMLVTLLVMVLGFWAYSIAMALTRVQQIMLQRERATDWVRTTCGYL